MLSTLHTMDAPKTIQRIASVFDLNEENFLRARLADSLKAVISQRLVQRCDTRERTAVFEIMRKTMAIEDCIKDPAKTETIRDLIASGRAQYGMQTFDQHLMKLFKAGKIDMDTAKAASTSGADFEQGVQFIQ